MGARLRVAGKVTLDDGSCDRAAEQIALKLTAAEERHRLVDPAIGLGRVAEHRNDQSSTGVAMGS